MRFTSLISAALLAGLAAAPIAAQEAPAGPPGLPPGMKLPPGFEKMMAAQQARLSQWRTSLPQGTGPWRVVRLEEPGLPGHTVYRPANLARVPRLPIVAFANGGCRNTSIEFAAFLAELASRGYLVIAVGTDDVPFSGGFGPAPASPGGKPAQRMDVKALTEAVDWAVAEAGRRGSPYRGRIAADRVAYVGQSCGGLQALNASTDPRTTTTVVLNSGYFKLPPPGAAPGPQRPMPMNMPARLPWSSFTRPIAYFAGGKTDIAYVNAYDNFAEARGVPMFIASREVGHADAYPGPDRPWAAAVTAWLDWQLKGKAAAKAQFVGPHCGLCKDPGWSEVRSHDLR